jgi:hypothetical protein
MKTGARVSAAAAAAAQLAALPWPPGCLAAAAAAAAVGPSLLPTACADTNPVKLSSTSKFRRSTAALTVDPPALRADDMPRLFGGACTAAGVVCCCCCCCCAGCRVCASTASPAAASPRPSGDAASARRLPLYECEALIVCGPPSMPVGWQGCLDNGSEHTAEGLSSDAGARPSTCRFHKG